MAAAVDSSGHGAIPVDGISLRGLREYVQRRGKEAFAGKSTAEVCRHIVKPDTVADGASYCQLHRGCASTVGRATVFVSHAWAYAFLDVVDALERWAAGQPPHVAASTFFWFDLFSNAQHGASSRPFSWWTTVFTDNVRAIGHTLLVLEWSRPLVLSRAWCVFEVACTLQAGAHLEVIMSAGEEERFHSALLASFDAVVSTACMMDVAHAHAEHEEDRARILQAVRAGVGVEETNRRVIGAMRGWMAGRGEGLVAELEGREGEASTCHTLSAVARLLHGQGDLPRATAIFRRAVAAAAAARLGPAHPDTVRAVSGLAEVLTDSGALGEAEGLFNTAAAALTLSLPPPSLLDTSTLHLARAKWLDYAVKHRDAEALLRATIAALQEGGRTGGSDDPSSHAALLARCTLRCAVAVREQGNNAAALTMLEGVASTFMGPALGPRHPDTLEFLIARAWSLGRAGAGEAGAGHSSAVAVCREVVGHSHPLTLRALVNHATWLHGQGRDGEAEALALEGWRGRVAVLGPDHKATKRAFAEVTKIAHALAAGRRGVDTEGRAARASSQGGDVQELTRGVGHLHLDDPLLHAASDRFSAFFSSFIGREDAATGLCRALHTAGGVVAGGACTAAVCDARTWSTSDMDVWVPSDGAASLLAYLASVPDVFQLGVRLTRGEGGSAGEGGGSAGEGGDDASIGSTDDGDYLFSSDGRLARWVRSITEVGVMHSSSPTRRPGVLQVMTLLPGRGVEALVDTFDLTPVQLVARPEGGGTRRFSVQGPGLQAASRWDCTWSAGALAELDSLPTSAVCDWRRTLLRGVKYAARGFVVNFSAWNDAWRTWRGRLGCVHGDYAPAGWLSTCHAAAVVERFLLMLPPAPGGPPSGGLGSKHASVCCALLLALHAGTVGHEQKLRALLASAGGVPPGPFAEWWAREVDRWRVARHHHHHHQLGRVPPRVQPGVGATSPPLTTATHCIILCSVETTGRVYPRVVMLKGEVAGWGGGGDDEQPADTLRAPTRPTFSALVQPGKAIEPWATSGHGIASVDVADSPALGAVWSAFLAWVEGVGGGQPVVLVGYNGFGHDWPVLVTDLDRVGARIPDSTRLASLAYEQRVRAGCMCPHLPPARFTRLVDLHAALVGGEAESMDKRLPAHRGRDVELMGEAYAAAVRAHAFSLSPALTMSPAEVRDSAVRAGGVLAFKVSAHDCVALPNAAPLAAITGIGEATARRAEERGLRCVGDLRAVYASLRAGGLGGSAVASPPTHVPAAPAGASPLDAWLEAADSHPAVAAWLEKHVRLSRAWVVHAVGQMVTVEEGGGSVATP